eukprot:gene7074-11054_t
MVLPQPLPDLSPELNGVYAKRGDRRALRFGTLDEFEASWAALDATHPHQDRLRDGKCAEAARASRAGRLWRLLQRRTSHDAKQALRGAGAAAQANCVTGHNNDGTAPACTGTLPGWPEEAEWNGTGFGRYSK